MTNLRHYTTSVYFYNAIYRQNCMCINENLIYVIMYIYWNHIYDILAYMDVYVIQIYHDIIHIKKV